MPSPNVKGAVADTTGVCVGIQVFDKVAVSLPGEPGGVVLSSGIVDKGEDLEDSDTSNDGGEDVIWWELTSA